MSMTRVFAGNSHNADGWFFNTPDIDLFLTRDGGMIAPVSFRTGTMTVHPYHLTPWQDENKCTLPQKGCIRNLRGEFFCMPFGGNAEPVNGERHPGHGEPTAESWSFSGMTESPESVIASFDIDVHVRKAHIHKEIRVVRGHSALYLTDTISGCSGAMPLGHHPILRMPADGKRMFLSFGAFDFGMTSPGVFCDPEKQAYQYLAHGAEFTDASHIPTLFRSPEFADFTVYPTPYGYCDLFTVFKKPSDSPAWTAAVYPDDGYLWFALKDASVLPATNVWVSNSGRFFAPWNGRTYCIGVEDTCSYFADGLKHSVEHNRLNDLGFKTAVSFDATPVSIRVIQGILPIPSGFEKVANVSFENGRAIFTDIAGLHAEGPVDASFVMANPRNEMKATL